MASFRDSGEIKGGGGTTIFGINSSGTGCIGSSLAISVVGDMEFFSPFSIDSLVHSLRKVDIIYLKGDLFLWLV